MDALLSMAANTFALVLAHVMERLLMQPSQAEMKARD